MLTAPSRGFRFDAGSRFRWLAFQDEGHGGWGLPKQLPHGADDSVHLCAILVRALVARRGTLPDLLLRARPYG